MRTVQIDIDVPGRPAVEVYDTLADFEAYPGLAPAVQEVRVTRVSDTVTRSEWEVTFRAGLLRWTEEDEFDADALTITFHQLAGDIAVFDGSWTVSEIDGGARIVFAARLDMGIPSLADALEPIAVRTLIENTVSIVTGLVGTANLVNSTVAKAALVGAK